MRPEIVVAPLPALADVLANRLQLASEEALGTRGRFTLAVPGGSVATTFFPRLARLTLEWHRTHLFFVDERAVLPSDPESNFGLAERLWLLPGRVPAASAHRMAGEASDLQAAAHGYAVTLEQWAGGPPVLDLVLLGVGPDGHVASLFPGHPLLRELREPVAAVVDAPKPPPHRLTLTLPVLAAARLVVVAAFGPQKATPMAAALEDGSSELPVALVLRQAADALVLLDPAARGSLRRNSYQRAVTPT